MHNKVFLEVCALIGNVVTWAGVAIAQVQQLRDWASLLATCTAILMSLATARYYYHKTKRIIDGTDKDS